jgi:hypothetical protein
MVVTETESEVFLNRMGTDGICRTVVKPFAEISLAHAIKNTENIILLSSGVLVPLLVDLRKIKSISKEARDHFSMRGRTNRVNAIAMLINSPASKVIGNFYILFSKPTTPTKLFTDENQALAWLRQFIQAQ